MENLLASLLLGIVCFGLGFATGLSVRDENIASNCDSFHMFAHKETVYLCEVRK